MDSVYRRLNQDPTAARELNSPPAGSDLEKRRVGAQPHPCDGKNLKEMHTTYAGTQVTVIHPAERPYTVVVCHCEE